MTSENSVVPPPSHHERWLRLAERIAPLLLTLLVPVAGGVWAVYVYLQSQSDLAAKQAQEQLAQTRTRLVELQRPFIEQQFKTFKEFTSLVGDLLVYTGDRPRWDERMHAYWRMHWGDVALVEDEDVHRAKQLYGQALSAYVKEGNDGTYKNLQDASKELTSAMRRGIQNSWTGYLGERK
jgi:hypothetical protein